MPRARANTERKKPARQPRPLNPAICVRMEPELFKILAEDALANERTPPAQLRLIARKHYGLGQGEPAKTPPA